MTDSIDYYFTSASPFAYMGHRALAEIVKKRGKNINFKPFNIFGVWEKSGAVPPAERPPVRNRYRLIEIQRIAVMRNVCMNPKPAFFPTDPSNADHCICALMIAGENPESFCKAAGRALWEQEQQIADESVLRTLLEECGHDADTIWDIAVSDKASDMRNRNTEDAIKHDAIGAPAYVYKGEVFWGQDRLEYLDDMIASGRKAFSAEI